MALHYGSYGGSNSAGASYAVPSTYDQRNQDQELARRLQAQEILEAQMAAYSRGPTSSQNTYPRSPGLPDSRLGSMAYYPQMQLQHGAPGGSPYAVTVARGVPMQPAPSPTIAMGQPPMATAVNAMSIDRMRRNHEFTPVWMISRYIRCQAIMDTMTLFILLVPVYPNLLPLSVLPLGGFFAPPTYHFKYIRMYMVLLLFLIAFRIVIVVLFASLFAILLGVLGICAETRLFFQARRLYSLLKPLSAQDRQALKGYRPVRAPSAPWF